LYSDVIGDSLTLTKDIEDGILSSNLSWIPAEINGGLNKDIRDTYSISIPFINGIVEDFSDFQDAFKKTLSNIFYDSIFKLENEYMTSFGVAFSDHDSYQILKYSKGQKFTNHIDDHPQYLRRISSIYYINDDYIGGEINFPRFNISYKPKANEMLVFPSTYVYNHSVSEVTDGTRYSVVSWLK
jgi:Rps23 Pro-64 3,4-dihydroxylase Tpa1-like proline 4-hydroxylase